MTSFSREAWNQLKNKTIQDIQRALERDGHPSLGRGTPVDELTV